jgi:presenilin-like A22 family membrane protease
MGFGKAFGYGDMKQLAIPVSKPIGVCWMVAAFMFIVTIVLFLLKKDYWWMIGLVAAIISQFVIILSWNDAKFGTIANVILLMLIVINWKYQL